MKILLTFILIGVACCLAVPLCSKEEVQKCSEVRKCTKGSEEEELNKTCSETQCWLKIYNRCGAEIFNFNGPFGAKNFKNYVKKLCLPTSPLRRKYLENISCIRNVTGSSSLGGSQKLLKSCGIIRRSKEEYCRKIPGGMKCLTDHISRVCGEDAGDAFRVASLPGLDPYDCLSQ